MAFTDVSFHSGGHRFKKVCSRPNTHCYISVFVCLLLVQETALLKDICQFTT